MKILLTGGSGLLGQELQKHLKVDAPSHINLDICRPIVPKRYDLIIHAAAETNTTKAEKERLSCLQTNVYGTLNLLTAYPKTPFVYISSEYALKPVNFYSWTKKWAEEMVQQRDNYLIIRTLFKPYPYPYERAFVDQYTQGSDVITIAKLIAEEIENWDLKSKLIYVGTGRKTLFELAKKTKPDVLGNITSEWTKITGVKYPTDYQ